MVEGREGGREGKKGKASLFPWARHRATEKIDGRRRWWWRIPSFTL